MHGSCFCARPTVTRKASSPVLRRESTRISREQAASERGDELSPNYPAAVRRVPLSSRSGSLPKWTLDSARYFVPASQTTGIGIPIPFHAMASETTAAQCVRGEYTRMRAERLFLCYSALSATTRSLDDAEVNTEGQNLLPSSELWGSASALSEMTCAKPKCDARAVATAAARAFHALDS